MKRAEGKAYARAGLMGNPSDVYEGKAIAFIVRNFGATVTLEEAERFEIRRGTEDALEFPNLTEAADALDDRGCYDGIRLLRAAVHRFAHHWPEFRALPKGDARLRFAMSYATTVPRQVGMSGSSAIVIAATRGLANWFGVEIAPHELAEIALAAETDDLGITAGPMDRVIQAYEGVVHMDFKPPRGAHSYTRLNPAMLPPLFIAYDPRTGQASGKVHSDVRFRWLKGDKDVRDAIAVFPRLVDEAMERIKEGDVEGLKRLVNENFDTRAKIWKLSERDLELVRIGRELGAATKFCGSGGAVTGVMTRESEYEPISAAYAARGYKTIRPQILPEGARD